MRVAGIVLAGGRSSRFGRDKALALLDGQPLIHWSLNALRPSADIMAINGPEPLCDHLGLPRVADRQDVAAGPLAGILSALAWAAARRCSHVLTAPCDTPFLPPDMGAKLVAGIGSTPVNAARAERAHPLCALWRIDAQQELESLAAEPNQPSLQALIPILGGGWLDFPDEAAFANLNTPDEFQQAERRFAG